MTTRTTAPPTPRIPAGNLRADGSIIDPTEPATAAALARDDAATTPAPKPWGMLPCPLCGQADARISISLNDMDTCYCAECEGDFSLGVVRDLIRRWTPLLRWLSTSPGSEE